MQPVRRFAIDAAILFSDILVVPHALGQSVTFRDGVGPVLERVSGPSDLSQLTLEGLTGRLERVYEAIERVRDELDETTALIGFSGAPWTVATYMVEGGSSRDFASVKSWAYRDRESFGALIDLLVSAISEHLIEQANHGAEVIQIFDTWAGVLPANEARRWSLEPIKEIATRFKATHPEVPVIAFPRGVGVLSKEYAAEGGIDALSLDTSIPAQWASTEVQTICPVQGNLDPILVVIGGEAMKMGANAILDALGHGPFVFNLGHGIVPQTPPEHVARLAKLVHGWRA